MSWLFSITLITTLCSSMLLAGHTSGQSIREVKVSLKFDRASLQQVFTAIEEVTEFKFLRDPKIDQRSDQLTFNVNQKSVAFILEKVSAQTGLSFKQLNGTIVVKATETFNKGKFNKPKSGVVRYDRIIQGQVTDENDKPLAGVNILIKGTSQGTITDVDGKYALEIPANATILLVSYVGYGTKEILIGERSVININMEVDITSLNEVVVSTGYWNTTEKLNPGNIRKVTAREIERQPVVNPLEALQGRVAGVQIRQTSGIPGSALNINIRGLNSLNNGQILDGIDLPNSNRPFYVVDGVPFPSNSLNANSIGGLDDGSPLANIRPSDIESIEILKDADATAIYGSRGANGVVLITTKKGKPGKMKIDLNFSMGVGEVANRVDLLNTTQYLALRRESISNDRFALRPSDSLQLVELFAWDQERYTDWQEELLGGVAEQTNAGVSISGGTAQTQYLIRGNFFRQTNVFRFDDSAFESGSGHFYFSQRSIDNRFRASFSTTYTFTGNNQNAIGLAGEALTLPPNAPVLFDENGDINFADRFDNPLAFIEQEYQNDSRNLLSNVVLSYEVLSGLTLKSVLGYNNITTDELSIIPLSSRPPEERDRNGTSLLAETNEESWILEPQVQYSSKFGWSNLNILLGSTLQNSLREGITVQGNNYESDVLIRNLQAAPALEIRRNEFVEYRYIAAYARLNYTWKDKYIFNLTGRRDGSSRFGPDKRFGNFWAVGAAWILSEEEFVKKNFNFISFSKLRGSYGLTGNDQIGDYGFLNTYLSSGDGGISQYNGNTALTIARAANREFSWETNKKFELGLELGLFKSRVNIAASWFQNRSSDQLIGQPLSVVTGFNTTQFNLPALVENRGLELEISTLNIDHEEFQWTTSLNFTRYRNELLEFPNIEDFSAFNNRYVVGESIFGEKQLKVLGVNPETGEYDFVDYNGDGRIGIEDEQDYVEVVQDYFGGIGNSFQWKEFQLDVFFQFVKQNAVDFTFFSIVGGSNNQHIDVLERWQNPGDVTSIQRASRFGLRGVSSTNAALSDASYLRLQNVSLSWQLPKKLISRAKLSHARIFVNGQNLWTVTNYEGLDPETQGFSLPPLRTVSSGIQLTF